MLPSTTRFATHTDRVAPDSSRLNSPRLSTSQQYLPQLDGKVILGAGERNKLGAETLAEQAGARFENEVGQSLEARFTVYTDAGLPFTYSDLANGLSISGQPMLFAWSPGDNNTVVPDPDYNQRFNANWELLRQANPLVVRSLERSFRLVSFFRSQKKRSLDNWKAFVQSVSRIAVPSVPTPTMLHNG
jgi:hypothetical protein